MLACSNKGDVRCAATDLEMVDIDSAEMVGNVTKTVETCGSDFAFPFFISFYFLCSFLVRFQTVKTD